MLFPPLTNTDLPAPPPAPAPAPAAEDEVNARYDAINARVRETVPDWPGDITVEESVRDQLALFDSVGLEKSGRFVRRDGEDGTLGEFRV